MLVTTFNLQGHRGARGLRPGNTLPSFETALDVGVTSIETDLHLSRDGQVIVCHDPTLSDRQYRRLAGAALDTAAAQPLVSTLTRKELAVFVADMNADPMRFPDQEPLVTPCAAAFAQQHDLHPYSLPTLDELYAFVAAYGGELGQQTGKAADLRARANRVIIDLELKRVPARPERIGDAFDGRSAGLLEERVLECIRRHDAIERTVVRSFDHRSVRTIKDLEPRLRTAMIIANTAPVAPQELAVRAGASMYCPDVNFLDELQVRQLHEAGIAVVPWTANEPGDWERLLIWGVDGITTDYPHLLAELLRDRGIPY